jgi:hypothetical protein
MRVTDCLGEPDDRASLDVEGPWLRRGSDERAVERHAT